MSDRDRIIELLDCIPDYKIDYVLAYVQGVAAEPECMNENEMKQVALEKFASIQRIKRYGKEELEYQEKLVRAELHNLGISTEELELKEQ